MPKCSIEAVAESIVGNFDHLLDQSSTIRLRDRIERALTARDKEWREELKKARRKAQIEGYAAALEPFGFFMKKRRKQ